MVVWADRARARTDRAGAASTARQRAVINEWEQPRTRCACDQKVEVHGCQACSLPPTSIRLFRHIPAYPTLTINTLFYIYLPLSISHISSPSSNLRSVLLSRSSLPLPQAPILTSSPMHKTVSTALPYIFSQDSLPASLPASDFHLLTSYDDDHDCCPATKVLFFFQSTCLPRSSQLPSTP